MRETIVMVAVFVTVGLGLQAFAQSSDTFQDLQQLRDQLSQLNDREAEIKIRLTELEHDLKPENIERHFAGVGSVHPEELREARRKQLQIEKDRLTGQLSEIGQNRFLLQNQISITESKASQQGVLGASSVKPVQTQHPLLMTATIVRLGVLSFVLIVVVVVLVLIYKRQSANRP